jgi:hypothetical protein
LLHAAENDNFSARIGRAADFTFIRNHEFKAFYPFA